MSKETSCFLFCPSRLFCLNGFWGKDGIVLYCFSKGLQSTIPGEYSFDGLWLPGFYSQCRLTSETKDTPRSSKYHLCVFLFFVKGTRTTIISYAAYAICNHSGRHRPGDSKWPLHPQFGGHDSPLKGSLFHHPKKDTAWITWERTFPQLSIFQIVFPDFQGWLDVQIQKKHDRMARKTKPYDSYIISP